MNASIIIFTIPITSCTLICVRFLQIGPFISGLFDSVDTKMRDSDFLFFSATACPLLAIMDGLAYNNTDVGHGAVVNYSCAPGFTFSEWSEWQETECSLGGEWVPAIKTCLGEHILHNLNTVFKQKERTMVCPTG